MNWTLGKKKLKIVEKHHFETPSADDTIGSTEIPGILFTEFQNLKNQADCEPLAEEIMRLYQFVFVVVCLVGVGVVSAQDRIAPLPSTTPIPCDQRSFSIPFEIRSNGVADPPIEVELLYSSDRGVRWFSVERQPIEAKKFEFKAPSDGEYWFSFRTITMSGRITSTNQGGPNLRVLVDTQRGGAYSDVSVSASSSSDQSGSTVSQTPSPNDAPPRPNQRAVSTNSASPLTPDPKFDPTAPASNRFTDTTVSERPSSTTVDNATPITPPKPLRMQVRNGQEKKKSSPVPPVQPIVSPESVDETLASASEAVLPKLDGPNRIASSAENAEAKKPVDNRPLPTLFSPTGEIVPVKPIPERKVVEQPKKTVDPLLAEMSKFYDGQLTLEPTVQPKPKSALPSRVPGPVPANAAAAIAANRAAPTVPIPPAPTKSTERRNGPGCITDVSLNNTGDQPKMLVRWNTGDETLRMSLVDVLRGASADGPWLPVATNLPNNGEYWWFVMKDDFKPFHIAVRLRTPSGATTLEATVSPIRLNPSMFGNAKSE